VSLPTLGQGDDNGLSKTPNEKQNPLSAPQADNGFFLEEQNP
jgi:hypothetical protein